ncbi:hypothetical protein CQ10_21795 [Bradyrhizobium valentinum]|uniref:Uncharacterized protein n=1 Tax=Bradyrhizobium valentinum TaxID=1518501 RepID=A0A0R3LHZ5_9BRAD|nr:hypothetical protein CQ10_21795 [Bradyrhizobium valentinum]KRR05421.1 hypothetical protein CP49_02700 [Bradyrhizobium valentinum]
MVGLREGRFAHLARRRKQSNASHPVMVDKEKNQLIVVLSEGRDRGARGLVAVRLVGGLSLS